jgi:hypothetical protein
VAGTVENGISRAFGAVATRGTPLVATRVEPHVAIALHFVAPSKFETVLGKKRPTAGGIPWTTVMCLSLARPRPSRRGVAAAHLAT